jgi:hypothetical protein
VVGRGRARGIGESGVMEEEGFLGEEAEVKLGRDGVLPKRVALE